MRKGAGMWFEQNDGEKCNYLKATGLFRTHYFYLDKEPWIADRIFIRHKLRVHFKGNMYKDGYPYQIVHAWVWRGREHEFDGCMAELYNTSLLMGRDDYLEACEIMRKLNQKAWEHATNI